MTEQGRWPSATDYIDAVQHPSLVFSLGELKEARFDLDMYGIPDGCTGSNAIVFRAMLGPRTVALRCFTSQAGLSRERYLALARHVEADERGARWLVPAGWRDDALRVKGQHWPLIEMEWVNGRPLFSADKFHFHHQLVSRGLTVKRAVFVAYFLSIVFVVKNRW